MLLPTTPTQLFYNFISVAVGFGGVVPKCIEHGVVPWWIFYPFYGPVLERFIRVEECLKKPQHLDVK